MRALLIATFAMFLASTAGYAQQGTCSSYIAGCTQICQSVRNASGCEATCNNLRSTCIQTGTWQKRDGTTVSNLHRQ